jgi:hypothetical protein
MGRLKSAYRPKKQLSEEIPAENTPAAEIKSPVEPIIAAPPETPAVAVQIEPSSEASQALRRQLEAQQRAEELRRQQAAQAALPQQPLSREQRLELWKQQGLSEAEAQFLKDHPEMIDHPVITNQAATEAMQAGHRRNSTPYWEAVSMNFRNHLDRLQTQATTINPAEQPTPKFFEPPPPPAPPKAPSHLVSAPVSREAPGSRDLEFMFCDFKIFSNVLILGDEFHNVEITRAHCGPASA